MMKRNLILSLLIAVVFTLGFNTPVFAEGMYDDFGNYIEYDEYDPNEQDEEDPFFDMFNISWYIKHLGKDAYTISTASQLEGLSTLVNEGYVDEYGIVQYVDFQGVTITLGHDITLREGFIPIGRSEEFTFKGIFDGAGHTIKGLAVNENGGYAGLFGYLDGTVQDLTIEGTVESSGPVCGALAGYVSGHGVLRNCASSANVTGKAKIGGIAGHNDGGTVVGCVNYGNVEGTMKVGGVVGENWGTVRKCGNRGDVTSTVRGATTYGTGGVCGRSVSADSCIDRCFNAGNIFSGTEGTGGVCGYMNAPGAEIVRCFNTGHLTVRNNAVINTNNIRGYAGGIVGIAGVKGVKISDCYNAGSINNSDISGGVIGSYLNESKFSEEPYIINNYYLNNSGLKGIGSDHAGKALNIREGTRKLGQATLINSASKLGDAYREDVRNLYGADGYPILKWQVKLGKLESTRLPCVTEEMQSEYDRYMKKHPLTSAEGRTIMMFFHHSRFTSQAIGDFHEQ